MDNPGHSAPQSNRGRDDAMDSLEDLQVFFSDFFAGTSQSIHSEYAVQSIFSILC